MTDEKPYTDDDVEARLAKYREEWLWHPATDDEREGYGWHMSQMLYRLPRDGQTDDMKASIESMIADLAHSARVREPLEADYKALLERTDFLKAETQRQASGWAADKVRANELEAEVARLRESTVKDLALEAIEAAQTIGDREGVETGSLTWWYGEALDRGAQLGKLRAQLAAAAAVLDAREFAASRAGDGPWGQGNAVGIQSTVADIRAVLASPDAGAAHDAEVVEHE